MWQVTAVAYTRSKRSSSKGKAPGGTSRSVTRSESPDSATRDFARASTAGSMSTPVTWAAR